MAMEGYDDYGNPLVQGIVEATAVMTAVGTMGEKSSLAQRLQDAMGAAVVEMSEKGINDPILVKEAMMAAHQRVLDAEV